MSTGPISRTMQRALTTLRDGGIISLAERPKYVTTRTMEALVRRGMVRWEGSEEYGRWVLTGNEYPDPSDLQAAKRIAKWAKRAKGAK